MIKPDDGIDWFGVACVVLLVMFAAVMAFGRAESTPAEPKVIPYEEWSQADVK